MTGGVEQPLPAAPAAAPSGVLGPNDWVACALAALVEGGIGAVRIDPLARRLGVSRGSFYWHFTDRDALLKALLAAWDTRNTCPFLQILDLPETPPLVAILRYFEIWRRQSDFDPGLDSAMRDWARTAPEVAEAVRIADDRRMAVLEQLFLRLGYEPVEALVRTRTSYYHQIGYYALGIRQSAEERRALLPMYFRVLTGCPMPPGYDPAS
jgi:AcrR family transcriptional regulator